MKRPTLEEFKKKALADKETQKAYEALKHHDEEETFSIDEVFADLFAETSKPAVSLRGFRGRDEITQVELAEKLGISLSAVVEMESAKRPISKAMAMKLGTLFDTSYRAFL